MKILKRYTKTKYIIVNSFFIHKLEQETKITIRFLDTNSKFLKVKSYL